MEETHKPRWVKVVLILAALLILVFVLLMIWVGVNTLRPAPAGTILGVFGH